MCTGKTAFVLSEIAVSIISGSIQYVSLQTSIKTGVAPTAAMLSAVAKKVQDTVITSSPSPIPNARKAITKASVPFPQEIPYLRLHIMQILLQKP